MTAYEVKGGGIRQGCRVPFTDPGYTAPSPEEIREALRLGSLTGSAAGDLVGVTGRTVRKWTGGEREVPYSAWRFLLIEIGLALEGSHAKEI
ncbi:MAG: helix-turn-helix domain-containing protein [Woeseiaceae bacterium]